MNRHGTRWGIRRSKHSLSPPSLMGLGKWSPVLAHLAIAAEARAVDDVIDETEGGSR